MQLLVLKANSCHFMPCVIAAWAALVVTSTALGAYALPNMGAHTLRFGRHLPAGPGGVVMLRVRGMWDACMLCERHLAPSSCTGGQLPYEGYCDVQDARRGSSSAVMLA